MRITIKELRSVVRKVIKETQDISTLPFEDKDKKGYKDQIAGIKQPTPAQIKTKQVTKILQSLGITKDPNDQRKIMQTLLPFLQNMDPVDLFVASPDDLADQFMTQILKKSVTK